MADYSTKNWKIGLLASVSAVVICYVPCASMAEAVLLLPPHQQIHSQVLKLKPPHAKLPWLAEKALRSGIITVNEQLLTGNKGAAPLPHIQQVAKKQVSEVQTVSASVQLRPPVSEVLPWLKQPGQLSEVKAVARLENVDDDGQADEADEEVIALENTQRELAVKLTPPQIQKTDLKAKPAALAAQADAPILMLKTKVEHASAEETPFTVSMLVPASGEKTTLTPPKTAPTPVAQPVSELPKLTVPVAPVAASPVKTEDEETTQPTKAAAHADAAAELSDESKDIVERLPAEPRGAAGAKKAIAVEHKKHTGNEKDEVKKHEAYGIKIAVKKPRMDVYRTLESAYNSLVSGDQQYAITLYKEVLDQDPENTLALFGLATTYHRAGQIKLARPLYAQLLEIDPHNVEGLNNFLVLLADESPKQALEELEKLQKSHPGFSPVLAQMALIYQKQGDYAEAAKYMAKALALSPENLKYQYNMAIILDKMGDWAEAAKWYQGLILSSERGEKIPGNPQEIQQRLTFIRSNVSSVN